MELGFVGLKWRPRLLCSSFSCANATAISPLLFAPFHVAVAPVTMVSGSGLCAKVVVVDARHHMLGRLASILAKELLNGQKVVRPLSLFSIACIAFPASLAVEIPANNLLVFESGRCPLRGDLLVRWPCEAEDEVFEVLEEENEHQAQQGSYSFSRSSSYLVEDHPRVGLLSIS